MLSLRSKNTQWGGLVKKPVIDHQALIGLDVALRGSLPAGRSALLVGSPGAGKTILSLQTLAHHLDDLSRGAERNRGPSILKSRGTCHSNQVRELILGSKGVKLADAYSASGEVLTEPSCRIVGAPSDFVVVLAALGLDPM